MGLVQVTPPQALPVSLQEAALHLRIDSDLTADNPLVTSLVAAATRYAETFTGRQLVAAGWRATFDCFPGCRGRIQLFRPPLLSLDSITYVDYAGVTQTLATSRYQTDADRIVPWVMPAWTDIWPVARPGTLAAVTVNYTAGYATPFTASATTDALTLLGRTVTAGDRFRLQNSGGSLPGGLLADTDYYAVNVSGATCKLALTAGGSAVDITSTGDGTNFLGVIPEGIKAAILLLVAHWYERRGDADVPKAVDWMLSPYCVGEYA